MVSDAKYPKSGKRRYIIAGGGVGGVRGEQNGAHHHRRHNRAEAPSLQFLMMVRCFHRRSTETDRGFRKKKNNTKFPRSLSLSNKIQNLVVDMRQINNSHPNKCRQKKKKGRRGLAEALKGKVKAST